MKLRDFFYPSLLVSESFYPLLAREEELYREVEQAVAGGFYKRIETGSLKTDRARGQFVGLIEELNMGFTQWITNDINELGLNPSTIHRELRNKTIEEICRLVDVAAQSGADRVAMVSGPDLGEAFREEAGKGMEEVLFAVSEKMAEYPGMQLLLEPLDRGAHKNNFIGPTKEAVRLMKKVNAVHDNCRLSWDSAHVALNGEDFGESLKEAAEFMGHIHLANAVLDRTQKEYGDWHMPMGRPGFLDTACGIDILYKAYLVLGKEELTGVSIESRCQEWQIPSENEKRCRDFLEQILDSEVREGVS